MSELEIQLQALEPRALEALKQASDSAQLEAARQQFFGKKSELTQILRGMGALSADERPRVGQLGNQVRDRLQNELSERKAQIERAEMDAKLSAETIDVTLPPPPIPFGRRHPITQTMDDIIRIFSNLGFSVVEGPEVENVYYNFDALGIGADHPARYERDTLYVSATTWFCEPKLRRCRFA